MAYIQTAQQTVSGVLAADVANNGTFTVGYPSGTTQLDFNAGLAGSGNYIVLNGSDAKYTQAASQMSLSYGSTTITVTNTSGVTWTAGTGYTLMLDQADGNAVVWFNFSMNLADIAANDLFTDLRLGIDGVIEYVQWATTKAGTGSSAAATLTLKIGTTAVTGGALALTLANQTTVGSVLAATPTAANTLSKNSKITLTASSVTAFTAGSGFYSIRIRRTVANT